MRTNSNNKPLHQQFSDLDNRVFSAFCSTFKNVSWIADYKDNSDQYCGVDVQLTAKTFNRESTYDIEIKSVHLNKLLPYCFFQRDKWFRLLEWDNDVKLYFVIYPNHNKIAVWRVNGDLLNKSERDYTQMRKNTCNGATTVTKLVYKLELEDAKVFDFDLTPYKEQYNALHQKAA